MSTLRSLIGRVHRDERGAVSLETILIVGAIALPILIFLIKVAWPRIQTMFDDNMRDLENGSDVVTGGGHNNT